MKSIELFLTLGIATTISLSTTGVTNANESELTIKEAKSETWLISESAEGGEGTYEGSAEGGEGGEGTYKEPVEGGEGGEGGEGTYEELEGGEGGEGTYKEPVEGGEGGEGS